MNSRLTNLRTLLKQNSLDALFISSLPNIAYLTNYTGFSMVDRDAFLLITKTTQYIFTHGIYKEAVKNSIKDFALIEIKRENPISTAIKNAVTEHSIKKLGFEAFDLKVSEFDRLTKQIDKDMLVATDLIGKLRIHKSPEELDALKKACALGDKAFAYILEKIKPGITENELAAQLEFFIKCQNADVSFPTIVAFEENAAHPHHMPTSKKLAKDNFVLLDFGVLLNNYCSDMTRTVSFGKANAEKRKIYRTVYDAQQKAIEFLIPRLPASPAGGSSLITDGKPIKASAVDKAAREHIISQGFPSIPHSLGRGIGLEVHESPRLTTVSEETLDEGMVFSIEPGIYLPGEIGVRIEDLFAIEKNKLVKLTNSQSNLIEV